MLRRVTLIAALAVNVFLDAGSHAKAQPATPTAEDKPYLYLWAAPDPGQGGWGTLAGRASQMVRWYSNVGTAQNVATHLETIAASQIASGATDPNHVCILLQNFGQWSGGTNPTSFIVPADATPPPPGGWTGLPPECPELPNLQPWMNNARPIVAQWMLDFLANYDGPTPTRFHFDSEIKLSSCCNVNFTISLAQATQDPRWGSSETDPGLAVPGSADYLVSSGGLDKQMWKLYEEALERFPDWPNKPLFIPGGNPNDFALKINAGPNDPQNRRYFLWYGEICQRALDAAMNECAYEVIKNHPNYANCKVSNYGYVDADGKSDTFGWHTGRTDTGQPVPTTTPHPTNPPAPLISTRKCVRGVIDRYNEGARFMWSDLIEEDPGTQQEIRRSLWVTTPAVASGDFSSPVLYPPSPVHWDGSDLWGERLHYYLPKENGNWPMAGPSRITLDYSRRSMESIINSFDGNNLDIVPWIRPIGQQAPGYVTTAIDFRDMLAMLRAKKVPEIIVWWAGENYEPNWPTALAIMDRVYKPQLNKIRILSGSCTNCPPSPAQIPVDRLRYTLREEVPDDEFVGIAANQASDPVEVAVQFTFGDVASLLGKGPMAINIECSAYAFETPAGVTDISGLIYVRDPVHQDWKLQSFIDDFTADPNMEGFGFHAPINAEPATSPGYYAPLWHETRRTFDGIANYIANDKIDIKIVFKRNYASDPFTIRFDLVQLVGLPDALGGDEGLAQGADFNHSQTTESYDVAAFMDAYAAGAEAADFNNDGIVNADDLTAFNAAFVSGPP